MRDTRLRWLYAAALAAIAFALVPAVPLGSAQLLGPVARAAIAASVLGLAAPRARAWAMAVLGALGAVAGCAALLAVAASRESAWVVVAAVLVGAAASAGMSTAGARIGGRRAGMVGLAVALAVALWFSGVLPTSSGEPQVVARAATLRRAPVPERYDFDGSVFLRTYDLMRRGAPYYAAFRQAIIDDSRHDASFLTSPLNYREPLVFELWQVLPGSSGLDLLGWFALWSLGTMVAAYWLASDLAPPAAALLAPIALMRFFAFFWWADRTWFTITEVWAAGLAVAAVAALVRGHRRTSLVFLVLAVASRELLVVLIGAWIADWWFRNPPRRRAEVWFPLAAILAPGAVLAAHVASVPPLAPGGGGGGAWFHGGLPRLADALMFGWSPLAHGSSWVALAIAVLALGAAARAVPLSRRAVLLVVVVSTIGFLFAFSGGAAWLYWGAAFTPLLAAMAPGALAWTVRTPGEDDAEGSTAD